MAGLGVTADGLDPDRYDEVSRHAEVLVVGGGWAGSHAALAAARAGACAPDWSTGTLVAELKGEGVEALLSRLSDSQARPRNAGQASRVRLMDIAAVVWPDGRDRAGLLSRERSPLGTVVELRSGSDLKLAAH